MTQDATMNPGPHHEPPSSTAIRSRLLGESAITVPGERVSPSPHRTKGLLAALLLYPRPQRRARLAGMLSSDVPEHKGQHDPCRAPGTPDKPGVVVRLGNLAVFGIAE